MDVTRPRMEWISYQKAAELCQVSLPEFVAWARRRAAVGKAQTLEEIGIPRREWEISIESLPREAFGRLRRWWIAQDVMAQVVSSVGVRIPSYRFDVAPDVYDEPEAVSDLPTGPTQLSFLNTPSPKTRRRTRTKGTVCNTLIADVPAPPKQLPLFLMHSAPDSQTAA